MQPGDDDLLTVEEVCEITRLAQRTIRSWMASGRLPYVRIGGEGKVPVRIRRSDVLALIRPGAPSA